MGGEIQVVPGPLSFLDPAQYRRGRHVRRKSSPNEFFDNDEVAGAVAALDNFVPD
jgi:hypothetical protein